MRRRKEFKNKRFMTLREILTIMGDSAHISYSIRGNYKRRRVFPLTRNLYREAEKKFFFKKKV